MTYKISLSSVRIPARAETLTLESMHAGKVGQSEYVVQFENSIAEFVGAKHCIAVTNGTMADAVAVAAMKEKYGIKRVVVPALTFIAQPNSVRYNNLEVVFADVTPDWVLDMDSYQERNRMDIETMFFYTDLMGRPVDADFAGLLMIEDACEAFGTYANGKYAGTVGEMGTYSFFPSHTISTGEGGAIVTDDDRLAELCRAIRSHGAASNDPDKKFTFPYFGFNARMTTMQACIGIALMDEVKFQIAERRSIFMLMSQYLGGFYDRAGELVVPHGYPIGFETNKLRDTALKTLIEAGVECRKFFSCIPTDEVQYMQSARFPFAEHISHTHLYLPCHQNMTKQDVEYIAVIVDRLEGRVK